MTISKILAKADKETLHEIIREAESFLADQLSSGLAADQRALAFAGALAAGAIVVFGAGASILLGNSIPHLIGWMGISVSVVLILSVYRAVKSSMPSEFYFTGNAPSEWIGDVVKKKPLTESLAEQAQHYDENIKKNGKILRENAKQMAGAIWLAWGGLLIGATLTTIILKSST